MNAEIGAEAALFPEKEYINGIAVAVHGLPIRTGCKALRRKRHTYMVISVYCSGNEWDQVMSMLPDTLPLAKRLLLSIYHRSLPYRGM
jgi:hypothetical protein